MNVIYYKATKFSSVEKGYVNFHADPNIVWDSPFRAKRIPICHLYETWAWSFERERVNDPPIQF